MAKYQLNYAAQRPSMYDRASRERKAQRMIRALGEYFSYERLSSLTVLDVGSSTGIIDNILAGEFKKVVGSDIDEGAVNYAKKTFERKGLKFQIGDAMNLKFKDNTFDVVICAQVYEHVSNQEKLFSEVYRVLKPGGVCYLAALNKLRVLEPHYNLPFLSWLPKPIANLYLKLTGNGNSYFETLRTYWELKKLNRKFKILDLTKEIIVSPKKYGYEDVIPENHFLTVLLRFAAYFYKFFSPTFFWLLIKPKKDSVKSGVDAEWTPTPAFLYRSYLYKKIAEQFPRDHYFLDVGAGNGMFLNSLIELGFKGEAIDISEEAIEFARSQVKDKESVKIKYEDVFKYNPLSKFDIVFCLETLEHIEDDQKAMRKVFELLKPGGAFVLSVPAHKDEWLRIDELKGHLRRYERAELVGKLSQSGFAVKRIYSYGFPLLWLTRKIGGSGRYLQSKSRHKGAHAKTKESSIQREYNPRLKFLATNKFLLWPLFKFMDLFLNTDRGIGYIVICTKPK